MRRNNTVSPLLWAALTLPVLYLAALLASGYEEGMTVFDLMGHFSGLLERPFAIRWTPHTPQIHAGSPADLRLLRGALLLHQGEQEAR